MSYGNKETSSLQLLVAVGLAGPVGQRASATIAISWVGEVGRGGWPAWRGGVRAGWCAGRSAAGCGRPGG